MSQMNNRYGECCGCPAHMSDARLFTNYQKSSVVNQQIRAANNIETNNQYRQYLQNNAVTILKNIENDNNTNLVCQTNVGKQCSSFSLNQMCGC